MSVEGGSQPPTTEGKQMQGTFDDLAGGWQVSWACAVAVGTLLMNSACLFAPGELEQARKAADLRDRPRAIDIYTRYLNSNPNDFDVRLEFTLLLGENWAIEGGDRSPILENLELLYASRPDNRRVRELFGAMLVREGQAAAASRRYEEGEKLFLLAADVNPDVGTAYYHLGALYAEWNRPQDAFEQYVVAARKRPPIPDLYLRLGRAYLERGEQDRAINTLGLVLALRGTSTYLVPQARCELARAHNQRGDRQLALDYLERAGDSCLLIAG